MSIEARNEAERAVVSFALTAPETFAKASVNINPNDFVDRDLGRLCWVLSKMQSSYDLRDLNLVLRLLQNQGELQNFGASEIVKLAQEGYYPHNVDWYVDRIQHYGKIDRIRKAAQALLDSCGADIEDRAVIDNALATFQASANQIFKPKDESLKLVQHGEKLHDRMTNPDDDNSTGKLVTGFRCIDNTAGGFFRGQLIYLSGRSYRGKTALAANIATSLIRNGSKVAVHNLEMSALEMAERFYSDIADVNYWRFTQGQFSTTDCQKMLKSLRETSDWPLYINESTSENIDSLIGKIEYEHMVNKIDVVFIDHLQRIENNSRLDKRHYLKNCCSQLKTLARKLNVAVVLLTQLRTVDDKQSDEQPSEADYSEARQIIEEADLAMMLHRQPNEAGGKLIFVKVRKGPRSEEYLRFDGEHQRFYEDKPRVDASVDDGTGHHFAQTDFSMDGEGNVPF